MNLRTCIYCMKPKSIARHPPEDPKFCSIKCISGKAYESVMDKAWCDKHKEWFDRRDGCDECNDEEGISRNL